KEGEAHEKTALLQPSILEALGGIIPLNLNSTSQIEEPLTFILRGEGKEERSFLSYTLKENINPLEIYQLLRKTSSGVQEGELLEEGWGVELTPKPYTESADKFLTFEQKEEDVLSGGKLTAGNSGQGFQKPVEPISLLEDALEPKVREDMGKVKKEEEGGDTSFFYGQGYKEVILSKDYEETRVEATEKRPVPSQESKHINLRVEEANVKLNLLGERLKLFINLKEEAYVQPSTFEVQKLVQSLQSLGYTLEVLRINGSNLYSSEGRQGGKREEREKGNPDLLKNLSEASEYRNESFSLYL
ncbi:MAG: hypothetical protein NZ827_06225, partial [Aquificaceae bacterium]|nr:hypothetical protein [Aquificaceae bacterium]